MILINTFFICIYRGLIINTFWFSYVLFLIFLGGIIVLFIYITALASNEIFNISLKFTTLLILFFLIIFYIIVIFFDFITFINFNNIEINNINFNLINKENTLTLNKLYNFPSNLITILLINYLFFTLIVIVKITSFYSGPLRILY